MARPTLMVMADRTGAMFEHPTLEMAGASGMHVVRPDADTVRPLPPFTKLFFIPDSGAVGLDPYTGAHRTVRSFHGGRVYAAAAFLPPGHLRLLLPAAVPAPRRPPLPQWAYSAVGWDGEQFVAPFLTLDETPRWSPQNYDDHEVAPGVDRLRRTFPGNRLVAHLARCALEYHCFAAKNLFLCRWEAPLPTSRACNAACLGCLSCQPPDGCAPSHERIAFTPTVAEVVEIAIHHLTRAEDPIVSFGQGCEGEPLTEAALIEASITRMRDATDRGVINLNTNGYSAPLVRRLCRAGLDSIRISLASARPEYYARYHQPVGFSLEDVSDAMAAAANEGVFTMVNYLVMPGITDQPEEIEAVVRLARATGVSFIHLKNLNIDPWYCIRKLGAADWPPGVGMHRLVELLRSQLSGVRLGYFNRWELGRIQ